MVEIKFSTSSDRSELMFLKVPSFSTVLDLADTKQNIQLNAILVQCFAQWLHVNWRCIRVAGKGHVSIKIALINKGKSRLGQFYQIVETSFCIHASLKKIWQWYNCYTSKATVYDQTNPLSASPIPILWFGRILYPVYIFYITTRYVIVLY